MSDTLYGGRRFRIFTLIDNVSREDLATEVEVSLLAKGFGRVSEQVSAWPAQPERLRIVNGPEFHAVAFVPWGGQTAYVERLDGPVQHRRIPIGVQ
jgi:putative transposase